MRNRIVHLGITCIAISLFSILGCRPYVKIDIDYRQAPAVMVVQSRSLAIHPFKNNSNYANAAQDVKSIIFNMLTDDDDDFFSEIVQLSDALIDLNSEFTLDDLIKNSSNYNWEAIQKKCGTELLLMGAIEFEADDFSGYESKWVYNQYGYRVPRKIWVDKARYVYELQLILVDLISGEIIIDKQFDEDVVVEGFADEVSGLLDLGEMSVKEFNELMQGEKVKAFRYLLYK